MKWIFVVIVAAAAGFGILRYQGVSLDSLLSEGEGETSDDGQSWWQGVVDMAGTGEVDLKDIDGRSLECRIVAVKGDQVEIVRSADQRKFAFPIARLDQASQAKVEEWKQENTAAVGSVERYEEAKKHVRVTVVVSENIDGTPELKRFLTAQDFNYVIYDAFKSSRGRALLQEHNLVHGPAFIIGDEVIVGMQMSRIIKAIEAEYEKSQAQ